MEAPFLKKKMESYDYKKRLCYIHIHFCRALFYTTVLLSGSVLEAFKIHIMPCICNDTFSLIMYMNRVFRLLRFEGWSHRITKNIFLEVYDSMCFLCAPTKHNNNIIQWSYGSVLQSNMKEIKGYVCRMVSRRWKYLQKKCFTVAQENFRIPLNNDRESCLFCTRVNLYGKVMLVSTCFCELIAVFQNKYRYIFVEKSFMIVWIPFSKRRSLYYSSKKLGLYIFEGNEVKWSRKGGNQLYQRFMAEWLWLLM